jgi:AcrR family transcriptional regulator
MPRVTAAHVEARRNQILEAARVCFLRKGFHETSMQEIFREAGLSAGAVYLYFKSKDELIVTIATERLAVVVEGLNDLLAGGELPPLEELPMQLIGPLLLAHPDEGLERLAVQIFSESQHNPAIAALTNRVVTMMLGNLGRAVDLYKARGMIDPAIPSEPVARVIAALVHGFIVQRSLDATLTEATFFAGLQAFQARLPDGRSILDGATGDGAGK